MARLYLSRKTLVFAIPFLLFLLPFSQQAKAQYTDQLTIDFLLKTDTTSIGQRIAYPQVEQAEVSMIRITMPPGANTGWHKHRIPLFAYILQGTLTVTQENGASNQFHAGTAVAEMRDVYHQGVNEGTEPVILIAVYLGGDAIPLAERKGN